MEWVPITTGCPGGPVGPPQAHTGVVVVLIPPHAFRGGISTAAGVASARPHRPTRHPPTPTYPRSTSAAAAKQAACTGDTGCLA